MGCFKFCYEFYFLCLFLYALAKSISRFISNRFLLLWACDVLCFSAAFLFAILYILLIS